MNSVKVAYNWIAPYYFYGAMAFASLSILLLQVKHPEDFHFAHPVVIAAVHAVTLGWASMLIFGAGQQLVPVILNTPLYSVRLLKFNFITAAIGIPLIITGMFKFDFGLLTITGAILMTLSAISFSSNVFLTAKNSKSGNIQSLYLKSSSVWLVLTCLLGLTQAINFKHFILPFDSFKLLSTHAHAGMIGFVATTVVAVSSKLIPMFTLSNYRDDSRLKIIFLLIHIGLFDYILSEFFDASFLKLSYIAFAVAVVLYLHFTWKVFKKRMRKNIDFPLKGAMSFQVALIPILLIALFQVSADIDSNKMRTIYGIIWLLGAFGALMIGMTFKTFPFMAWNERKDKDSNLLPKDLYSQKALKLCFSLFLSGTLLMCAAISLEQTTLYQSAMFCMVLSSAIFMYMTIRIHKFTI